MDEWDEYDEASREELEVESPEPEVKTEIKEVIVEKEVPIIKEVIKEVPVEKIIYREPKQGTKITAREFDVGKALMFVVGGIVLLGVMAGGLWLYNQEWKNVLQKPVITKQKPVIKKVYKTKWKTKYKTKWKTKTIKDQQTERENRILKENLATAYARIRSLKQAVNRPVHCKFKHNLKIIDLRGR